MTVLRRIGHSSYLTLLFLAPLVWEIGAGVALAASGGRLSESVVLAIVKIGFALLLLVAAIGTGSWQSWGFAGGLRRDTWHLLWPIWIASVISLAQDFLHPDAVKFLIWLPIAFAVAIGEEGIFRGAILAALDAARPRRSVMIQAFLFGAIHLVALLPTLLVYIAGLKHIALQIPVIDWRMVVAQASFACGMGIILGAVRLLSGSIWPGIITHGILDYTGLVAAGSLTEALSYSSSGVVFMALAAAVAAAWGLVLCQRLPANSG